MPAPPPVSNRLGAGVLKRVVRRLTAWEIDPLVHQLNGVRAAAIDAIERAAAPPTGDGRPTDGPPVSS